MKIFRTKSIDTIQQCHWYFGITDTKLRTAKRKIKFLAKYCNAQNELCKIFADVGRRESADLSTEVELAELLLNNVRSIKFKVAL